MSQPGRYPARIFWSDEDEGFIATAPDLPGCSAFGDDEAEALAELRLAIVAWIEAATAAGNPVPPPSQPVETKASGKFLVRAPKSLHQCLVEGARDDGVSLNQHVVYLLTLASTHRSIQSLYRDSVMSYVQGVAGTEVKCWTLPKRIASGTGAFFFFDNFLRQASHSGQSLGASLATHYYKPRLLPLRITNG